MSCKTVKTDLEAGVLHSSEWVNDWAVGNIGFHQSTYDPFLDTYGQKMFEGKTKSVFLPLCGKTPDIIWMYQQGHTVVGVEIAEQAIRELFEENSLQAEVCDIPNIGKLYRTQDDRIRMYVGDLFDLSKELLGQFDLIWDSRSLVAINLDDHQVYRDLLLSLMKPDGQYFLSTLEYEPSIWPGPPHTFPDEMVKSLFEKKCNIELLEEKNMKSLSKEDFKPDTLIKKAATAEEALESTPYLCTRWYRLTYN